MAFTTTWAPARAAAPALLLLFAVAAVAARPDPLLAASGRALLDDRPCCEDCAKKGDQVATFQCFTNCQNCVSGAACLELSQSVAGSVAQVACEYADQQCAPLATAKAGFQAPREQCYRAAKNVCITYGEDYAQGSCSGYNNGFGDCDSFRWRQLFGQKLDEICDSVGKGIAIFLP